MIFLRVENKKRKVIYCTHTRLLAHTNLSLFQFIFGKVLNSFEGGVGGRGEGDEGE